MRGDYPADLLEAIQEVTAHRPRTVLQHILEHGSVTTEELKDLYGYNHPPRAARDVREQGVPLRMTRVADKNGRKIGSYSIDVESFEQRRTDRTFGRRAFPAELKRRLMDQSGLCCQICARGVAHPVDLQVDHRVPFEIGGTHRWPTPTRSCWSVHRATA